MPILSAATPMKRIGVVLLLAVSLSACSTSGDTKQDQSAETQREIQESSDAYLQALATQVAIADWPAGYAPDVARIHERTTAPDMVFADPQAQAVIVAAGFQQCAWFMAWLDAQQRNDIAAQDAAMSVLLDPNLYAGYDDTSRDVLLDMARTASMGDPSGPNAFVDQNCLPDDWLERS